MKPESERATESKVNSGDTSVFGGQLLKSYSSLSKRSASFLALVSLDKKGLPTFLVLSARCSSLALA